MSKRFYLLGGMDDQNLKQTFINSLLEPFGNEASKVLGTKGLTLQNTSLGELY